MPYFLKTRISLKPLEQGLQSIYGVGRKTAKQQSKLSGLVWTTNSKNLRSFHRRQLGSGFNKASHRLGEELGYQVHQSIAHLTSLKTYRGIRHIRKIPVRGQRTHTNARTQKNFDRVGKQKNLGSR